MDENKDYLGENDNESEPAPEAPEQEATEAAAQEKSAVEESAGEKPAGEDTVAEESVEDDTAAEEPIEEEPDKEPAEEPEVADTQDTVEQASAQAEEIMEGTAVFAGQEQTIVYREPLTERLCARCGEKEKAEGSNYCEECEQSMLTVKIPGLAWLAGIAAMLAAVVGLAFSFLNCAAALQVTKGDIEAAKGCWNNAYTAYSEVDAVAQEINATIGGNFSAVIVGERIAVRKLVSMAHVYSPVDAGYSIEQNYPAVAGKYKKLAASEKAYKDYYAAYRACSDILDAFTGGNMTYDEARAQIDTAVEGGEFDSCYVSYIKFSIAKYAGESNENLLALLKESEKAGPDKGWLYNTDFVDVYLAVGDFDSAEKYSNLLIDDNKNSGEAYYNKLMCLMARDKKDEAFALCDEFDGNNPGNETVYTLRVAAMRRFGDIDGAKELCQKGIEECQSVAEHYRQLAIINILQGDYDAAFDAAYQADYMAYSLYYYSGDNSMYTPQLSDTVYLASCLCKEYGKGTGENAAHVIDFIESFESELDSVSQEVKDILAGTKTPEDVFMKGAGDLV